MKKILFMLLAIVASISANADTDNYIYANPATCKAGESTTISICMKNVEKITAFEFKVRFPEGITPSYTEKRGNKNYTTKLTEERTDAECHTFNAKYTAGGEFLVICYSNENYDILDNDGEICTMSVDVAEGLADGEYKLELYDVVLTDLNKVAHDGTAEAIVVVGTGDAIKNVNAKLQDNACVNLAGQRVTDSAKGIIIQNGKKVVK